MKKIICLVLAFFLAAGSAAVYPVHAADLLEDIPGVDYSRLSFDASMGHYTSTAKVGQFTFEGELSRSGKLDREELNGIIYEIFKQNGIDSSYLLMAEERVEAARQDGIIDFDSCYHIVDNIATIFGVDNLWHGIVDGELAVMGVTSNRREKVLHELVETGVFDRNQYNALKYSMQNLGTAQGFLEFAGSMTVDLYTKLRDYNIEEYQIVNAAEATPVVNAIMMTYNLLKVCYEEHKKDVERWDRRVKALDACYFLKSFYSSVEELCQHRFSEIGQWILSINGTGERTFAFLNSTGNKQYMTFSCNMIKTDKSNPSDRHTPVGTYRGAISINLTHDLSNFNAVFWNNQCGKLAKNWLANCENTKLMNVSQDGTTWISRTLKTLPSTSFTIYSNSYIRSITTRKTSTVKEHYKLTRFLIDKVNIECTKTAYAGGGIANFQPGGGVTASGGGEISVHAQPGAGKIDIYLDSCKGDVSFLGSTYWEADMGPQKIGSIWDDNIWESVRYGVDISVYM